MKRGSYERFEERAPERTVGRHRGIGHWLIVALTIGVIGMMIVLATGCQSTGTQGTTTTTKAPDGTITVTESPEAMETRLFHERCSMVLEGGGL